ncbi:MAG: FAD-dependent thymidylate synthase [Clostridia bacterium]|nr:FAD-dependent thymidylate synthase [Clostridia bacterium]
MKVTLLAHSPEAEKIVAAAAKLCYSPADIDTVMDGLTDEKTASFIDMLASIGHESPTEHVTFTFGIEGVSRSLLAQITRHRMASFSVQSQRYVREKMFEFVLPPEIEAVPEAKEEFLRAMEEDQRHYEQLTEILKKKHMETMDAKAAEKKAIEDARFVLPNACVTKMICTMNTRSLMNFFRHRCCNRAQWEIRELAEQMLREVVRVAPHLFVKAGPACYKGACPEGKMTCGKCMEMRARYAQIHAEEAAK